MFSNQVSNRWAGVGHSDLPDAAAAGKAAARAARAERDETKLVVVFCAETYDLAALISAVNEVFDHAPLIGCSTAGEIATSGPGDAGVVVFALGGAGFTVHTAIARDSSHDLRGSGARAARPAQHLDAHQHQVLMLLTDSLAGDQHEVLRGAFAAAGAAIPLVGGCAGDGLKMRRTFQFHGDEIVTDAIVSAAVGSDGPFGIGVRHGWEPVGEPMLISRADAEVVHEIDGGPALDVYLERLQAPAEAWTDEQAFTRFALVHPIGLARRSGEPHARVVLSADFQSRSLVCIAAAPEGSTAWFMRGDDASVQRATEAACQDALGDLGAPPIGVLAFDCIARREVLGTGITREIETIAKHAGNAPVAGFYTYGEIARTRGTGGFHNETLVVLAVG